MSKHAASYVGQQDTLKGVQGIATASPDAFSILRMLKICACMSKHAASYVGWHDTLF